MCAAFVAAARLQEYIFVLAALHVEVQALSAEAKRSILDRARTLYSVVGDVVQACTDPFFCQGNYTDLLPLCCGHYDNVYNTVGDCTDGCIAQKQA